MKVEYLPASVSTLQGVADALVDPDAMLSDDISSEHSTIRNEY